MTRAESMAAAAVYLSEAAAALAGAVVTLVRLDLDDAVDVVRSVQRPVEALSQEISSAAWAAHRAERPEFYDESGRFVGPYGKGKN
ncbi:hypothetical protein [Promicromonospora sp. NPDC019610]|uniref:hypothetical protein n=1 Tax=Promicromonospora sp. NPDC019610 TaxID=3364405 RepID=UPI00378B7AC7